MLTCQRGNGDRHGRAALLASQTLKPRGARDLAARSHTGAGHRAGNVDNTNWHTQITLLCAALTVFQHAETSAQIGGSEPPRVRWRLRCFGLGNDYSVIFAG
jgi:hypothetical protein